MRNNEKYFSRIKRKSMIENTKRFKKRLARYEAFTLFAGVRVAPHKIPELIRGLVRDREKHEAYEIHHKVNINGLR